MSGGLDVFLDTPKVGRVWLDERRRFVFAYDANWLASNTAVPLSLHLPLRAEPYDDEQAHPFFANLLPESDLRRRVARRLGLSEHNDFALLEAVGGECAGAISLLPEGAEPAGSGRYKPLSDDELNQLVAELPQRPLLAGEEGIRLSLAGAQSKLPVLFDGRQVSLPMGEAASTHILKPPIVHYPDTVENEYFCMRLAHRVGLAVPQVTLLRKAESLYLVERCDRKRIASGDIKRIHQEDFCQALGILPYQKYEKEGGPGLQMCFNLVRQRSIQPVADVRALLHWVVFNYLIGNADAHAKNISLLLTRQGPSLAPFYDLMCTAVYPELTPKLAMKIGTEDRPDWVIERRWRRFAEDVGVNFKMVRQNLVDLNETIETQANQLAQQFRVEHGGCPIVDRILEVIQTRKKKITNALADAD